MALALAGGMLSRITSRVAVPCRLGALLLVGCAGDLDDPGADEVGETSAAIVVCGTSIQAAIDDAPPGAVLEICAGTYEGPLVIRDKSLTLRGTAGAANTIIDAGADGPALRVINTPAPGVAVRRLTLRNGRNTGAGGGIRCISSRLIVNGSVIAGSQAAGGGGLYARACALTISGTRFENNDGNSQMGGGAWVVNSSGEIRTSTFLDNTAERGGGVAVQGGTMVLRNSTLRGNHGLVRGGGLYHASNAAVLRTQILDNRSSWIGGGVYVFQNAPTISLSTIRGNTSVNDGGGLYIHQSRVRLLDNTIAGNLAEDDGGGVRVFESESRLERNLIQNNQSGDGGGGIRLSHLRSVLIDNVVRGNTSGYIGGGIELDNDSSVVRGGLVSGNSAGVGGGMAITKAPFNGCLIQGVEIVDNDADVGGGLYVADNYVPIAMRLLTIEGNQATRGAGLHIEATSFTLDHAVFDGNVAAGEGGAIAHAAAGACPEAPCPPANPVGNIDFIVAYRNAAEAGGFLWSNATGLSIENSIIEGNIGSSVDLDGGVAPPTWRWNDTRPRSFDDMIDPTGADGNISANPIFVDPAAGNFRLGAGSPARNAGDPSLTDANGTRADMGRYGGL
jgi:predicted outer membrane repeat protein